MQQNQGGLNSGGLFPQAGGTEPKRRGKIWATLLEIFWIRYVTYPIPKALAENAEANNVESSVADGLELNLCS